MAAIVPNQKLIHDRQVYEAGETYEVPSELAFYFRQMGWVGNTSDTPQAVALDIQNSTIGHAAEVKK